MDNVLCRAITVLPENTCDAVVTELDIGGIQAFGDAIGVQEEHIADFEAHSVLCVWRVGEEANYHTTDRKPLNGAVGTRKHTRIMASIAVSELAIGGIEDGEEERHKTLGWHVGAEGSVQPGDKFGRRETIFGMGSYSGLERAHEQSGGYTFAAHITHDDCDSAG